MGYLDVIRTVWENQDLAARTLEHLYMFGLAMLGAGIIGIAIGIIIYKRKRSAAIVFNLLNVSETIPTLALLVLLLPVFGLGSAPTIITSIIYSILPVARNTYAGLTSVSSEHLFVAESLGLSEWNILTRVRMPLALPLIAGGLRIALVFTMGVVTLGGLVAAGGLGAPIQTGIQLYDKGIIVVTGLWVGLLAVILDAIAGIIEKRLEVRR